ncbi:MAG TPA: hypothetical protein VFJ84_00765 [Candidatus Saccharimonadales bacterium]|nr:hypothetical protein [Candidatus Saccharimonadales bacterium]
MRIVILYHPNSEQAGPAETFKHDFEAAHYGYKVELLSLETTEGAELAKLYDIVRYPAILVLGPEDRLQQMWQDQPWPPMGEVYAYAQN